MKSNFLILANTAVKLATIGSLFLLTGCAKQTDIRQREDAQSSTKRKEIMDEQKKGEDRTIYKPDILRPRSEKIPS